MSCLHIQGVQRDGEDTPLHFWSPVTDRFKRARLRSMMRSSNPSIRRAAAGNPALAYSDQMFLLADESQDVRGWLARNPNAHPWVLIVLHRDASEVVRAHAAWNRLMPTRYLARLERDPSYAVRSIALQNLASRVVS